MSRYEIPLQPEDSEFVEHLITDANEEILATYNLCLVGPTELDKRVLADLPAMLEAVEEDLSDLLPDGYRATIKEWSDE